MSRAIADISRTYSGAGDDMPPHTQGQRVKDHRGYEWIFVKAGSTIPQNHVAVVTEAHEGQQITNARSDRGDRVGVRLHSQLTDGHYGWLCIYGTGDIDVLASTTHNTQLYTTATAGVLHNTSTGQQLITGITLTVARGGTRGLAPAQFWYPYAD